MEFFVLDRYSTQDFTMKNFSESFIPLFFVLLRTLSLDISMPVLFSPR